MDTLLTTARLEQIEHIVKERQHIRVTELSEYLGVSEPTIRRDLKKLELMGRVKREHGGVSAAELATVEPPIVQRGVENREEKRSIGRLAASLIKDGETIFLGSGTTTLEVARCLENKQKLTVITNALNVAYHLAEKENITLIITGGVVRHSELSMIGHIAEQTLKDLRADKAIISMRAVSLQDGLTSIDPLETITDRVIIQCAREVILVADNTKFGKVATNIVAPATAVQKIITDDRTSEEIVSQLRALGIEVLQPSMAQDM
ncbi:DeoR/GlpR family DNA-binding transcription regulator [Ktedonospora formicarum]|uniref:DeoR family transcriptional regulator n=1 Tax=Ktedonospora formicarum TaxID=2778364 RepID=A0A8J3HZC7_9CHLR|nr:DeoR/GlpR family DNA-binding transcription regulator [Ktedonospora formicarum]GHO43293.1 DeoR family transcriptional regulator [Ktedonospora formicarum]